MSQVIAAMEPRYGLDKAVAKFFPDGSITKDALKHQIRQGRLRAELIAGRYFVTESDLLALCLARQRNGQARSPANTDIDCTVLDSQSTPGGRHG